MSTRAAAATLALRAKENLIRILFQNKSGGVAAATAALATGVVSTTTTSRTTAGLAAGLSASVAVVDHSQYTYSDLRAAYLERIQQLHPDKQDRRQNNNHNTNSNDPELRTVSSTSATLTNTHESSSSSAEQFVQLLEAWNRYEAVTKESSSSKNNLEANFTWFGVGCSFADTDEQREARNRIMDMACRGWLPQGELGTSTSGSSGNGTGSGDSTSWIMSSLSNNHNNGNDPDSATTTTIRLCCDAMFLHGTADEGGGTAGDGDCPSTVLQRQRRETMEEEEEEMSTTLSLKQRSSLVAHLIPPHRR